MHKSLIFQTPLRGLDVYHPLFASAKDLSLNGYDGTLTGGASIVDNVLSLDGSNDYLLGGDDNLFDISTSTQSFTVSAWINPTALNASGPEEYRFTGIISKGALFVSFGYKSDGVLRFYTYDGSLRYLSSSGGVITTGTWQHVMAISDSGTLTLFKNNVSVAAGTLYAPVGAGNGVAPKIGCNDPTYTSDMMNGFMSRFAIFNRALTTAERAQIYNEQLSFFN